MTGGRRLVRQSQPPEGASTATDALLEPRGLGDVQQLSQGNDIRP